MKASRRTGRVTLGGTPLTSMETLVSFPRGTNVARPIRPAFLWVGSRLMLSNWFSVSAGGLAHPCSPTTTMTNTRPIAAFIARLLRRKAPLQ
ncbi:hypothetical protein D3C78_1832460 [compost metagenome]